MGSNKMLQKVLILSLIVLFGCQPPPAESPSITATVASPDRTNPPKLGEPKKLDLPLIQTSSLSNGIPVYLMEKHNVPIVQVILQVNSGNLNDPDNRVGLASFTASMLDEGAGEMNALELADAVDFLGANLVTGSGRYTTTVSLNVPTRKLEEAMPLIADVALRPLFPEKELNRLKARSLTSLLQERDSPNAIARAAYSKVIYGDHPFGRRTDESSIKSTSVADLQTFHAKHFVASNAKFIVVGDIEMSTAKKHLESHFNDWTSGKVLEMKVSDVQQVQGRNLYLVDKPGAVQSVIIVTRMAVSRYSEDFYPITVMNTILGGSFTSRLNWNLRETNGYAYGAGSRFSMGKYKGPFSASASVQTDATDKAIREFMNELNAIRDGISEEEIVRARNYVALGYPSRFETIGDYANQLASLINLELPFSTFNEYTSGILSVSVDEAVSSAKKYIDPENLSIVIVGDREKVEDGIKTLGLGKVTLWTIDDVLGPTPTIQ